MIDWMSAFLSNLPIWAKGIIIIYLVYLAISFISFIKKSIKKQFVKVTNIYVFAAVQAIFVYFINKF